MNQTALRELREWMKGQGFSRFFLARPENFAWISGGDNTVIVNEGVAWLEVTSSAVFLHTSRIEAERLKSEEVPEVDEVFSYPWYSVPDVAKPNDFEHDLTPLRLILSPEEQQKFRRLGQDAARALGEAVKEAKSTWTELELAGAVAEACHAYGITPVVLLVAGEDRIFRHRHPIPKVFPLGRLCMAVICGRRDGLVANLTRLRSFGHPQAPELYEKVLRIEAAALNATKPGASLDAVLSAIKEAYRKERVGEEFENHHQGGLAGYRPREVVAKPGLGLQLGEGMAVAWNPSIPGAKVEDTFLLSSQGLVNLTYDRSWPMVVVEGRERPALRER